MIGTLEIYKGYLTEDGPKVSDEPIFREENMIVDGAKEGIVDLLTRPASPSAITGSTRYSYDVSNFIVQGISIAPNESAFSKFHSLAGASGFVSDVTGNMQYPAGSEPDGILKTASIFWKCLDPSDTNAWSLLPDAPNYDFTAVNSGFSGATYINGVLENVTFSSTTNLLHNGNFSGYHLDSDLSAVSMNNILQLYELDRWSIQSCLRHQNNHVSYSANECASVAREGLFTLTSLKDVLSSGYYTSSDGVLRIRTWDSSAELTSSAIARIKQIFTPARATNAFTPRQADDPTLSVIAEIGGMIRSVDGSGAAVRIDLKNETTHKCYNFSAAASFARHEWGGSGTPLIVSLDKGTQQIISHFINIPNTMVNDRLSITFSFIGHKTTKEFAEMLFWDAGVNVLDGWYYGHVCEHDTLSRYYNNDHDNPQLFLQSTGRADLTKSISNLPLSSITYFSQLFKMAPNKLYTPNIWGECLDGYGEPSALFAAMDDPPGGPLLDIAIVKKATSTYRRKRKWNYITKAIGCNPSQWLRNLPDSGHVVNPDTGWGYGTARCRPLPNSGFHTYEFDPSAWIPACSGGANNLVETTLDQDSCWHYLLPRLSPGNSFGYRSKNVIFPLNAQVDPKPSDLCVQVNPTVHSFTNTSDGEFTTSAFSVSGEFGVPLTSEGTFTGKVLKNMYLDKTKNKSSCSKEMSMASATNFHFVLRSSRATLDSSPRYFNWSSGGWDITFTDANKFFTSSVERGTEEWAEFSSIDIDTTPLSGVVPFRKDASQTSGWIPDAYMGNEPYEKGWYGFSLVLSAINEDGVSNQTRGFFKELKFLAEPKTYAQDVPECFDWTTTGDGTTFANNWRVLNNSVSSFSDPQYSFSDVTTFPYVEYYNATGLSELPFECVGQMCYASGTIHSKETEYQFIVACTKQNNALSGTPSETYAAQAIRAVTLNDNSLVTVGVPISGDFFTSESYVPAPRFDILDYPHIQQLGKQKVTDSDYSGNYQGAHMKSPISDQTWMISSNISGQPHNWNDSCVVGFSTSACPNPAPQTSGLFPSKNAFQVGTRKFLGYGSLPDVTIARVFTLGDLNLDPSSDKLGCTVDYQMYENGNKGEPSLYWEAQAKLDDGTVLYWRDSAASTDAGTITTNTPVAMNEGQEEQTWIYTKQAVGLPVNPFTTWAAKGQYGAGGNTYKTLRIRPIDLTDNRLTPTTKIRVALKENSLNQEDVISIRNWNFYRVSPMPVLNSLPVFPNPIDTTVQPSTEEMQGELGHYSNTLQLDNPYAPYVTSSSLSFDRACANGGWAPPYGLGITRKFGELLAPFTVSGNIVSGIANRYGVVNSDGIMYRIPPGETPPDGMFLNGFSSTVSSLGGGSSAMLYCFDLSGDDVDFFNIFGGVGGVGLWTLNADETYRKFKKGGYTITDTVFNHTAWPYSTCLYNVTDVARNPVFKLFSKKVFKTPLEINDANFLRFRWYVQLV